MRYKIQIHDLYESGENSDFEFIISTKTFMTFYTDDLCETQQLINFLIKYCNSKFGCSIEDTETKKVIYKTDENPNKIDDYILGEE